MSNNDEIEGTDSFNGDDEVIQDDTLSDENKGDNDSDDSYDSDESNDQNEVEKLKKANAVLYKRLKQAKGLIQDESGNWVKRPETAKSPAPKTSKSTLTVEDAMVLMRANIIETEDINEVRDYANLKKISIAEAINKPTVKSLLAELAENRRVALATNTGPVRRNKSQASPDMIVSNAQNGKFPDNPEELAKASFELKYKDKIRRNKQG